VSLHVLPSARGAQELAGCELVAGMDAIGVSVVVTDLSGLILGWSDGAADLFGWAADQVLGHQVADVTRWGVSQSDATSVLLTANSAPWCALRHVVTAQGASIRVRISAALAGPDKKLVLSLATAASCDIGQSEADQPGDPFPDAYRTEH
jgi:PAS domain S-box-containing protein